MSLGTRGEEEPGPFSSYCAAASAQAAAGRNALASAWLPAPGPAPLLATSGMCRKALLLPQRPGVRLLGTRLDSVPTADATTTSSAPPYTYTHSCTTAAPCAELFASGADCGGVGQAGGGRRVRHPAGRHAGQVALHHRGVWVGIHLRPLRPAVEGEGRGGCMWVCGCGCGWVGFEGRGSRFGCRRALPCDSEWRREHRDGTFPPLAQRGQAAGGRAGGLSTLQGAATRF